MSRVLLLAILLLASCGEKPPVWYPSKVRAPGRFNPTVDRVAKMPAGCDVRAWGCYIPEDVKSATPGRIFILRGLHIDDDACVYEHEMKHWRGLDHDPGLADCGDGAHT